MAPDRKRSKRPYTSLGSIVPAVIGGNFLLSTSVLQASSIEKRGKPSWTLLTTRLSSTY